MRQHTIRQMMDAPCTVRPGEELDAARLAAWPGFTGVVTVEQFPSGFSNLTYLIRLGDRELVLRRPPFGSAVKSAHDVGREYRILEGLICVFPRVPRPVAFCEDLSVLGAPFYLMERVAGVIVRDRGPGDLRPLSEACIDLLADIHAVDLQATGLSDLGRGEGYVERQIRGWTERYVRARTDEVPG